MSLDGFAAQWLHDAKYALPTLRRMAREGVWGHGRTVLPSVTWPAHVSIVTGTLPSRHGVVGNRWYDRDRKRIVHASQIPAKDVIRVPTLYGIADRQGRKAAAVLWPLTQGATGLRWVVPEVYGQANFARYSSPQAWRDLRSSGLSAGRLAQLSRGEDVVLDRAAVTMALEVLGRYQPDLLLVHLTAGDTRAHRDGPGSPRHRRAMASYDDSVRRLRQGMKRAGLDRSTDLWIVSDHGFFAVTRQVDLQRHLRSVGLAVRVATNGHFAYVYLMGGTSRAKVVAALRALPYIEKVWVGADVDVLGLPAPSMHPGVGDVSVLCQPDHYFKPFAGSVSIRAAAHGGTHGYLPEVEANHPIFLAWGQGIARGRRIDLRNIDIAPTIAASMELKWEGRVDGRTVMGVLARP